MIASEMLALYFVLEEKVCIEWPHKPRPFYLVQPCSLLQETRMCFLTKIDCQAFASKSVKTVLALSIVSVV